MALIFVSHVFFVSIAPTPQFCYREVVMVAVLLGIWVFIDMITILMGNFETVKSKNWLIGRKKGMCMEKQKQKRREPHRVLFGAILILIGVSIFFPQIISGLVWRIIISLYLVWVGLRMIFNNNNNNNNNGNNKGEYGEK